MVIKTKTIRVDISFVKFLQNMRRKIVAEKGIILKDPQITKKIAKNVKYKHIKK